MSWNVGVHVVLHMNVCLHEQVGSSSHSENDSLKPGQTLYMYMLCILRNKATVA